MYIDHLNRTIQVTDKDLLYPKKGLVLENLNKSKPIWYLVPLMVREAGDVEVDENGDSFQNLGEIEYKLMRMKPAYSYLSRFKIDDYQLVWDELQKKKNKDF